MLELGQPNHTYDLDAVVGRHLGVRWARDGEKLVTLDDQTRALTSADGVIVDGDDTPIGLAGVMGGEASGWAKLPSTTTRSATTSAPQSSAAS